MFFLCLSSVYATDVTTCQNINTSGYYQFTGNISVNDGVCSFSNGCIFINASSVTLDLKGYSLINTGSCSYGIVILPKDVNDFSDKWNIINILNGNIIGFTATGIETAGGVGLSSYTYLNIFATLGNGDGIALDTEYNDITIGENYFNGINNAVIGNCGISCKLYDNEIINAKNGFYLNGNNFDLQRNVIGHSVNNDTICKKDEYPTEYGIVCNDCNNTIIKNNDIMSQTALGLTNHANHDNITDNIFRTYFNYNPLISFDSTTSNNLFCNNQIIHSHPTLVYDFNNEKNVCYYGTDTYNAKNIVLNSGSNTINDFCSSGCIQNWYCNETNRVYINSACSVTVTHSCEYGCESGIYGSYCIGNENTTTSSTTTTSISVNDKYNISYTTPVINVTDLNEAGVPFLIPFFMPIFLMFIIEIILSSVMAWISKQAVTFPITIFMLSLIFSYLGIMPLFITAISCIVTALLTAFMFKKMIG
jgi:hypothetical protein